jgi:hypothetical protein
MSTTPWIRDAQFETAKALPAAGASNQTNPWDLGAAADGNDPRQYVVAISVPALPNHTDPSKTITLTAQHSPDGSTWADVSPQIQARIPGVAGTGSAAAEFCFYLPPSVDKYVRFQQSVPAAGGDHTAQSVAYALLFH